MTARPSVDAGECFSCGAPISARRGQRECPACGAPLAPPAPRSDTLAPGMGVHLESRLLALNEQLVNAGARNAEDAFSLGCWMSAFLILAAGLLAFWLSEKNWIVVMVVVVSATLMAAGVANLLSLQAKSGAMRRVYREAVSPEVDQLLSDHQLERVELEELVHTSLSEEAPLRRYLISMSHNDRSPVGTQSEQE